MEVFPRVHNFGLSMEYRANVLPLAAMTGPCRFLMPMLMLPKKLIKNQEELLTGEAAPGR
jgi:hypothetical protein